MIVVTGASGTTGSEVVKRLSAAGIPVRAVVRNPQKKPAVAGPGVEPVAVDLEQPNRLGEVLRGAERLFLLVRSGPRQVEIESSLIEAARLQGVRHIVKLSALGADVDSSVPFGRWHGLAERFLEESDVPFTHLRPHYFMQNFFLFSQPIYLDSVVPAPAGNVRLGMIDARDIADAAVAALTEKGHEGKAYDLTGPEALSLEEAVRKLSAATGRTITYLDVAPEQARQQMLEENLPEWLVDATLRLYEAYRRGGGEIVTDTLTALIRKPARTFDEFARDYAEKFKPPGQRADESTPSASDAS